MYSIMEMKSTTGTDSVYKIFPQYTKHPHQGSAFFIAILFFHIHDGVMVHILYIVQVFQHV